MSEGAADDDLGDFFTEIEQIEKTAPADEKEDREERLGAETAETEVLKIAAPIEIVSKPQMNSRSHVVIHTGYGGTYTSSTVKVSHPLSLFLSTSLLVVTTVSSLSFNSRNILKK
jgi:hypothetical protein